MARLLSVNVGIPRDIAWNGRTVYTGIWKNPVRGRCRVGRLNLDGDGQGDLNGHGGEQREGGQPGRRVVAHQPEPDQVAGERDDHGLKGQRQQRGRSELLRPSLAGQRSLAQQLEPQDSAL